MNGKSGLNASEWINFINQIQTINMKYSNSSIPIIYGLDSVHGAVYVYGSTYFPHVRLVSFITRSASAKVPLAPMSARSSLRDSHRVESRSRRIVQHDRRHDPAPDFDQGHSVRMMLPRKNQSPICANLSRLCRHIRTRSHTRSVAAVPWNFDPVADLGVQPLWSRIYETVRLDTQTDVPPISRALSHDALEL